MRGSERAGGSIAALVLFLLFTQFSNRLPALGALAAYDSHSGDYVSARRPRCVCWASAAGSAPTNCRAAGGRVEQLAERTFGDIIVRQS